LSSTNSSANPTNVWRQNNPLLNGVEYHW
jgi:hypothetical protein